MMSKKRLSLVFLLLAIGAITFGLFCIRDLDVRNNILFLGVIFGVTGMILKIASMLKG